MLFLVPKYPYEANKFQNLGLIAGGTGIAPMVRSNNSFHFYLNITHHLIFKVQMMQEILFNPDDKTKITLLVANTTFADILMKQDLDKFAQKYPDRLKVIYTIDKFADKKETSAWKGETG